MNKKLSQQFRDVEGLKLNKQEIQTIMINACKVKSHTEKDLNKILDNVEEMKVYGAIAELSIAGEIAIFIENDEILCKIVGE